MSALDDEAVALPADGTIWVGEEYGPYIYHFDAIGNLDRRDPSSGGDHPPSQNPGEFLGRRDGQRPASIRAAEQSGFRRRMSVAPGGKYLFAMTKSALMQDLDPDNVKATRRNVRLLEYDIGGPPRSIHEYAVQLPLYADGEKTERSGAKRDVSPERSSVRALLLCAVTVAAGFTVQADSLPIASSTEVETGGASRHCRQVRWRGSGHSAGWRPQSRHPSRASDTISGHE